MGAGRGRLVVESTGVFASTEKAKGTRRAGQEGGNQRSGQGRYPTFVCG